MKIDLTRQDLQQIINLYTLVVAMIDDPDDEQHVAMYKKEMTMVMKVAKKLKLTTHDIDLMARKKLEERCISCRVTKLKRMAEKHDEKMGRMKTQ